MVPLVHMEFVLRPFRGIVDDIIGNGMIGLFVADNVFVVIALPDGLGLKIFNPYGWLGRLGL